MSKGANQDPQPVSSIAMDARKFLRTINESVSAKLSFFEKKISEIGNKHGKKLRLVALDKQHLVYEDVGANTYYRANITKDKNNYRIHDVKKIIITESEKSESFDSFCLDLVESIDSNDLGRAESAFNKIESSRFRSKVVPPSGVVRTKDGNIHKISILNNRLSTEDKSKLISTITEAISTRYDISSDGSIINAYFSESDQFKLPVTESLSRRVVARKMRTVAESAWKKDGFQKFVKTIAALVSKHQIEEAVQKSAEFLKEYQEFSLLTKTEFETLVENTLFANGVFNAMLAEHVSEVLYKTNIKTNKQEILESWDKTARKAQNSQWLTSVENLKESETFAEDYDKFISEVINESSGDSEVTLMALKFAREAMANQGETGDTESLKKIDDLIARLEKTESEDHSARDEAAEVLAGISHELLGRSQDLENFDSIPGEESVDDELVAPEGAVEDMAGADTGDDLAGLEGEPDLEADLAAPAAPVEGEAEAGGEPDLGSSEVPPSPAPEGEEEEALSFEEKKAKVAEYKKLYEQYNKNFSKMLAEEGPGSMVTGLEAHIAKMRNVGQLGQEIADKFEQMKQEISGMMGSAPADTGMVAGPVDAPAMAPEGDYAFGGADAEIDANYTDDIGGEAPVGDDLGDLEDTEVSGEMGAENAVPPAPEESEGEEAEGEGEEEEEEESEESKPAFGGKKAPPFGGKEKDDKDDEKESDEDLDEDQYKWPTHRHGQGKRAGLGRSSINPVEESIVQNDRYAMALSADDGNYWLLDKKINEAVCVGDGSGLFDFDLSTDNSYAQAAAKWMKGIVEDNRMADSFWKRALLEWEKPWEKKDKDTKKDSKPVPPKKDAKPEAPADDLDENLDAPNKPAKMGAVKPKSDLEETHLSGMHDKSPTAVKMNEAYECPACHSHKVTMDESAGECMCECGVVGKPTMFRQRMAESIADKGTSKKGTVDPKSSEYESEKAADNWGDGSKRNPEPKVKEDDEGGNKGAKEAPKSKAPENPKTDDLKDTKPGKSDMWKQQ